MAEKENPYDDTVNYRLDNIEQVLNELKNVIVDNKMQARDISELTKKVDEFLSAINSHEKRIRELEMRPDRDKASKFNSILTSIEKIVVAAVMAIILAKVGLQ